MLRTRTVALGCFCVLVGAVGWTVLAAVLRTNEPWDRPLYFRAGIPAFAVIAGIAGYLEPEHWKWWTFLIGGGQVLALFVPGIVREGLPNLFPFTLLIFAVLSLPGLALAYAGRKLAQRRTT